MEDDLRACALTDWGHYKCPSDTYCGSNYDALGNFRFVGLEKEVANDDFNGDRNWGYTNFDNAGFGFVTVFHVMSNEAWNEIMNIMRDCVGPSAICYIILLVVIVGFGFMQLFLGIFYLLPYPPIRT